MGGVHNSGRGKLARLLCYHRRAAQLTQEELAARAGLSTRMIRYLESGRTRCPRRESLRLLAQALNLDDADHEELLSTAWKERDTARIDVLPPDAVAAVSRGRLVGRDKILDAIVATTRSTPCTISLIGPPGDGKTCVAVAAGPALNERANFSVLWVSCPATIRHGRRDGAFHVPEHLIDRFAHEPWIVVLDAAEHWDTVVEHLTALGSAEHWCASW